MENGRTQLTDYRLLKISSKSCHLKKNPNNSILRDVNVNSFTFQIVELVNKKTDFIPTYIK